jgi:hypothetical protein
MGVKWASILFAWSAGDDDEGPECAEEAAASDDGRAVTFDLRARGRVFVAALEAAHVDQPDLSGGPGRARERVALGVRAFAAGAVGRLGQVRTRSEWRMSSPRSPGS